MSLYLLLNIGSFIIPFLYSFERKMHFIGLWKPVFLAIGIVAFPFIVWDIVFTKIGVWGFNNKYHYGLTLFGLPLEELLFFVCIPYASIFTHYAYIHFFGQFRLSAKMVKVISIGLFIIGSYFVVSTFPKLYTTVNLSVFLILLTFSLLVKKNYLAHFYITFVIILVPFFVVNGLLTGSFIHEEVVWYNNNENLGFRIGSIPIEDFVYAFNLLYLNLILIERLKPIFLNKRKINVK